MMDSAVIELMPDEIMSFNNPKLRAPEKQGVGQYFAPEGRKIEGHPPGNVFGSFPYFYLRVLIHQ
jgi:hypothetical protein